MPEVVDTPVALIWSLTLHICHTVWNYHMSIKMKNTLHKGDQLYANNAASWEPLPESPPFPPLSSHISCTDAQRTSSCFPLLHRHQAVGIVRSTPFCFSVLGMEPRAFRVLGKCSPTSCSLDYPCFNKAIGPFWRDPGTFQKWKYQKSTAVNRWWELGAPKLLTSHKKRADFKWQLAYFMFVWKPDQVSVPDAGTLLLCRRSVN
jgi:hypothetical protein